MLRYNRYNNKYYGFPIVASDNEDLFYSVVCVIAGTQGDIKVTTINDDVVIFKNTFQVFCQIKKVWNTDTTAGDLTGIVLYNITKKASTLSQPIQGFFLADTEGNFVPDQDGNYILVE